MYRRHEKCTKDVYLNTRRKDITGRYHLEEIGADERIILKWIIDKEVMNLWA